MDQKMPVKKQKKKEKQKNSKRVPMRMCAVCRKRLPKQDLVRFVLSNESIPIVDETGKVSGRGVNLCPEEGCLESAIAKGVFARNWKTDMKAVLWDDIRDSFREHLQKREFRDGNSRVTYRVKKKDAEVIIGDRVTRDPTD